MRKEFLIGLENGRDPKKNASVVRAKAQRCFIASLHNQIVFHMPSTWTSPHAWSNSLFISKNLDPFLEQTLILLFFPS